LAKRIDIYSHKIMVMDFEKRERVIKGPIREFSKGYKPASTDAVVREAGISKGLLFHYFETKEGLFEYAVWYAFEAMTAEYFDLINTGQPDLLDRLWQLTLLKADLSYKYPLIFEFLDAACLISAGDPSDTFCPLYKTMRDYVTAGIFSNFDYSVFRPGVNVRKAVNIVWWTIESYAAGKAAEAGKSGYDAYLSGIKEYFDIFRKILYK